MFPSLNATFSALLPLAFVSCFMVLLIRNLWIHSPGFMVLYHSVLFVGLFIFSIGGGSVQNDAYLRYEKFLYLEKTGGLEKAKKHPDSYDSMFQIDLGSYETSEAFKKDLKKHDQFVDQGEACMLGWLFALVAEVSRLCVWLVFRFRKRLSQENMS